MDNKLLVVIGGWLQTDNATGGPTNRAIAFDGNIWMELTSMSVSRYSPCAVQYRGFVIVTGGASQTDTSTEDLVQNRNSYCILPVVIILLVGISKVKDWHLKHRTINVIEISHR